jgi:hypothetical protein
MIYPHARSLRAISRPSSCLVGGGVQPAMPEFDDALNAFERSMADTDRLDHEAAAHRAGQLALYRTLVAAIKKISPEPMSAAQGGYEARVLAAE